MAKTTTRNQQEIKDYQSEIDRLKKEVDGLRGESQIATLKTEVEDLKKQKINAQISQQQSMTNISGYEEEFTRLKEDAIKQIKKNKSDKIKKSISTIVTIPFSAALVYFIFVYTKLIARFKFDPSDIKIIYWVYIVVFVIIEIQAFFDLFKSIVINTEVIPDQTLSYLSLTAKEHILDPKGSVIREKYGTEKWSSVTRT